MRYRIVWPHVMPSKTFKQYDHAYRHLAGTALKTIQNLAGSVAKEDIDACNEWPDIFRQHFTEDYDHHTIKFVVYECPEAEEWQMFRVSLKGLSTKEKLYALMWRWAYFVDPAKVEEIKKREIIRINNYLGALKRGGLLNSDLKVIRN